MANEAKKAFILNFLFQKLYEEFMINRIIIASNVPINDPLDGGPLTFDLL